MIAVDTNILVYVHRRDADFSPRSDQCGRRVGASTDGKVAGPMVHDARIAALCLGHGVRELWSADRDFSRFPALGVRNPLAA